MNDLSRRDLLTAMIQALFLALFPWLRTARGTLVARQAAQTWVTDNVFVLRPGGVAVGNVFTDWSALYARLTATAGAKAVLTDDSFAASTPLPSGTYDLRDVTLVGDGRLDVASGSDVTFIFNDKEPESA
jgi:hypothetical protein